MSSAASSPLDPLLEALESAEALDAPAQAVGNAVRGAIPAGPVKDALSGTWLGHALHPMLTDVVIGAWMSAVALDLFGGDRGGSARRRLTLLGVAAYGPTALTGASDWADSEVADPAVRRAGLVHAASNATALTLFTASLASPGSGRLLRLAGTTALMAGGFLGGHLTLRRGVGADQTVFDAGPEDWTPAVDGSQLRDGRPTRIVVGETPVVVVRHGETIHALHDRCSHRGCSLSDGEVEGEEIVCSCHGSRFSLSDGSVRQGPATAPQPAYEAREHGGRVEIRLASAG